MTHSHNKIWVHAVWATKDRDPLIRPEIEEIIYGNMRNEFEGIGCAVKIINGMPEHVHCLFLLNPLKSIAEVIKQIKGSTSHFINDKNLTKEKFIWQSGYAAYSVSESQLIKVYNYILNQKVHHSNKSYGDEYDAFLSLNGLEKN